MQIDWLTVIAQIVNFLVLVWLLRRFLYQPVIKAMDQREQRIANRLKEAEQREKVARKIVQKYENKRLELEQTRQQRLRETEEAAQRTSKALMEEAHRETDKKRQLWLTQLEQEQQGYLKGLRKASVRAIQDIGRKTLADLANTDLETQIVQVFLQRLKSLDEDHRKTLLHSKAPVLVSSAFELDATIKGQITRAIHELIASSVEVTYSRSPELLCGIVLKTGGYQISWALANHLNDLDEHMIKVFHSQ